jgi:PIN domain nuclease of toxin-antitoxin system
MRLLLDTNAFLWWRDASPRLPDRVRDEIGDPQNEIVVSIVSFWEIAIKRGLGKLRFLDDFEAVMAEEEFDLLGINYSHLRSLDGLPLHHRDPFDRLLISQSVAENLTVATDDQIFARYRVSTYW